MKNFLFSVFAIVLFFNISKGQNLEEKLKKLEESSLKLDRIVEDFPFNNIKSSNNNYDFNGLELHNSLCEIKIIIKTQKENKADYVEDVEPLILDLQKDLPFNNLILNEEEKLIFNSYVKNLEMNTAISKAKIYEEFIYNNYLNQNEVKNLLIILSQFKYISYQLRPRSLSSFESCVVSCMGNTFSQYNGVDWFLFVAGNPGRGVLQAFASCSWDCW